MLCKEQRLSEEVEMADFEFKVFKYNYTLKQIAL